MNLDLILTLGVVLVAAIFAGRTLRKNWRGKGCGCGCDSANEPASCAGCPQLNKSPKSILDQKKP